MTTKVTSPTGNIHQGHSGTVMGGLQGSMQGAQAGFSVGGAWGAVIGGIIGGIAGNIGGAFADRSKVYERKAQAWAKLGKQRSASIQVRDAVEQFRQQRAMQMVAVTAEAGGNLSSTPMGAISSYASQYAFGMAFNEGQNFIQGKVQKNLNKAHKSAQMAGQVMAGISAISSTVGSFGKFGAMGGGSNSGNTFGIGAQNSSPSVANNQWGSNSFGGGDWSSFGPQPYKG